MAKLIDIEGIGPAYAAKLEGIGVSSVEKLLEKGATKKGREALAEKSGISEKRILEWVNRADLARIKGVGSEYADLLEAAGVDTVPELAQRKPENLAAKMAEISKQKNLTRKVPSAKEVADWVEQAKKLPRIVVY
ncbi:MAG: DUF4332 domain-containing protein [Armatimonadetes bacterium]|nr:DUF4332 domain-containing protein [Armatimonadota bacterium]HOC31003.1 DUF4332 domain-containing protein [Armatimonadota bacterium]